MSVFLVAVSVLVGVTGAAVLARLLCASTPVERMLAGSLAGSLGVAFLLLLAQVGEAPVLVDVALVLAVLVAVVVSAVAARPQAARPGVAEERAR